MSEGSSALAVVDAIDDVPVVWWVDLGSRTAGMSRLCGAWVLDGVDRARTLQTLTVQRMTLETAAGKSLLDEHQVATDRVVDVEATRAAVLALRDELQSAYEQAVSTRRSGRALTAPQWPTMPELLDVETAKALAGDTRTGRALAIALWFDDLCAVWDVIEEQRLARAYLRSLGGSGARALPVVIQTVRPKLVA